MKRRLLPLAVGIVWTSVASAQAPGPDNGETSSQPGQSSTVVVTPPTQSTTTIYQPYGLPAPGTDINSYLPSSSKPIIGDESDTFDLGPRSGGNTVVRGRNGAAGVLSSERVVSVPDIHLVRQGDTLWDLSGAYYQNPWQWPKIWKNNPQIQNPHWIYPGDQLRLRASNEIGGGAGGGGARASSTLGSGLVSRRPRVPHDTVFLRDQGFLGDSKRDVWGEIIGAIEEQMLLSDGNHVYISLRPGVNVQPGQELTVFRTVRPPDDVPGARKPPGEIVAINGTVRIDRWDPKSRIARADITESVDVIERGAKVGPVGRQFDVVPPVKNSRDVEARVLTSLYPHVYFAQNQVVFIDRGASDGLVPGNTLIILRKGDTWRKSLASGSKMVRDRVRMDSPEIVDIETTPLHGDPETFPAEGVAELRILRAEKYSSIAIVTQSRREVVPGDRAVAPAGR